MKERQLAAGIGLAAGIFLAGTAVFVNQTLKSQQSELQQLRQENRELAAGLEAAAKENSRLLALLADQEETAGISARDTDLMSRLEEGFAQRIRDIYSYHEMEVLDIYPVGEDTPESIQRFYLCEGRYWTEFYLVDYVSGEITDLGRRTPGVDLAGLDDILPEESRGVWPNGDVEWEFRAEDYDGDDEEDILLVTTFSKRNSGAVMLWLQREGNFLPVNRYYCGNYTGWQENHFSLSIAEQEKQFREEQNQQAWSVGNVGTWIREELLAGRAEELEETLQNPKKLLPYTQWRKPLGLHVTLAESGQGQCRVKIPENPYGEKRINEWIQTYYEEQEKYWKDFMGVGIDDGEGVYLTEQERAEAGFYYSYGLRPERVDDAVVCLISDSYEYSGGVHGNSYMYAATFDTQSGSLLKLGDVVYDVESFCRFAMGYIEEYYEEFPWGQWYVRDALTGNGWCFTGYGFRVFLVGGNGAGFYWYEIPYELLLDFLKEEYLPVSRAAEYDMPYGTLTERVQMDVNGDGLLDEVSPVTEDDDVFWAVNGVVTRIELPWQDSTLKELDINTRTRYVWLERQEDGITRLFWEVDLYGPGRGVYTVPDTRVYVYRIDGESFVYERDY